MHLYLALISCLVCTAHCWQFDGGGGAAGRGQRSARLPRNTARALAARGPPPGRGSAALLGSQQQDVLYACPLNSMCQCAGMPNETSTLIEINCNEVALYKFPGETKKGGGVYQPMAVGRSQLPMLCGRNTYWSAPAQGTRHKAPQLGCQYCPGNRQVGEGGQGWVTQGAGDLSRFIYVANIFVWLRYKLPQPQQKQRQFELPLPSKAPSPPYPSALPSTLSLSLFFCLCVSLSVSVACCRLRRNVIF